MSVEVEVGGVYEPAADLTPTGMISAFAGSSAPTGWFMCDGSAKNRTTENNLFDAIGTTFGTGDGSTTFNLPDLRGIFPRGAGVNGTMTKADTSAFDGGNVGDENNDKMQQLTGSWNQGGQGVAALGVSGVYKVGPAGSNRLGGITGASNILEFDSAGSTAEGGARTGDETAPASLSLNYLIKN